MDSITDLNYKFLQTPGIDASQGALAICSTEVLTIPAGGSLRAVVFNNSTKPMRLLRFVTFSTGLAFGRIYRNPTAGLPGSSLTINSALLGAPAPAGQAFADVHASVPVSGGVDTKLTIGFPPNRREIIDLPPLFLLPGDTLGLNVSSAAGCDATVSLFWVVK